MRNPKYVDANGIRTRYFETGQGEPLLLIHDSTYGEPYNAENWEPVFELFAPHFRIFAVDKLGQGYTDNPTTDADYVIGTASTHLADFCRALDLKHIHIAGHSRGGYTVCRLALEHPDLVETCIMVDSGTMMGNDGLFYERLEAQLRDIHDPADHYSYAERAHAWRTHHVNDLWIDGFVAIHNLPKTRVAAQKMGWGEDGLAGGSPHAITTEIGHNYFRDLAERRVETHNWIRQGRLKSKTLIVWGFNDPSASIDTIGFGLRNLVFPHVKKASMHILNEAGHHCYREQPEGFVSAVTAFIRS